MPLDKDQLHALLADYVEGSLSESQIEEAEAYLDANPGVRAAIDQLMIDSEALRALPPVRSPVDHSEPITVGAERDLLLNGTPADAGRPSRLGGPALAVAAMLLLGLGLAGTAYWLVTSRPAAFDYAHTVPAARSALASTRPAAEDLKADVARSQVDQREAEAGPIADNAERMQAPLAALDRDPQDAAPREERPRALDDAVAANGPPKGEALAATPASPDESLANRQGAMGGRGGFGGGGGGGGGEAGGGFGGAARRVAPGDGAAGDATATANADANAEPNEPGGAADMASNSTPMPAPAAKASVTRGSPADAVRAQLGQVEDEATRGARAILDSLPRERPALAIVVGDVGQVGEVRDRVRAIVPERRRADVITEQVGGQAVVAATLPADVGPLVATGLSSESIAEVRRALAEEPGVRLVELPATDDAERPKQQLEAPQQAMQQVSGAMVPRDRATGGDAAEARRDVYVVLVPADAPATRPAAR